MRSIAGAGNVGEGGVGASVATDLADRTLAALAAYSYNPVICRWCVHHYLNSLIYLLSKQ
jgi:hypothetical protein